ncbi:MAG: hypothetical protein JXR73_21205 [Candidatus Omnitrophica bacterium]|nr:hypothetical protein [Candidatus Omnitrophota bacterium]
MKSKNRSAKNHSHDVYHGKNPFSKTEWAIIKEELKDEEAYKRNLPIFSKLMEKNDPMRSMRINPFHLMNLMASRVGTAMATNTLTRESIQEGRIMDAVFQDVVDQIDPNFIMDVLMSAVKDTKIKREKRALLWATGELITTCLSQEGDQRASRVIQAIVFASMNHVMELTNRANTFFKEEEPFHFSYKKILDDSFDDDDWKALTDLTMSYEPDFTFYMSYQAADFCKKLSRPHGLRFYRILNYVSSRKPNQKRHVLLQGETEPNQNDENQDENFSEEQLRGITRDLLFQRIELCKSALQSMKSAAFGEVKDDLLNQSLNAAAYCMLSPVLFSMFIFQFIEKSVENAAQINPGDEKELIIDIIGSPKNTRLYEKYAQLLEQKGELAGAYLAYMRMEDLLENPDAELEKKILELRDKAEIDDSSAAYELARIIQSAAQPQNAFANEPKFD